MRQLVGRQGIVWSSKANASSSRAVPGALALELCGYSAAVATVESFGALAELGAPVSRAATSAGTSIRPLAQ